MLHCPVVVLVRGKALVRSAMLRLVYTSYIWLEPSTFGGIDDTNYLVHCIPVAIIRALVISYYAE